MNRWIFALGLIMCVARVGADERVMEIIPLNHRLAADVIPTLKQLVDANGTVTGMNDQLIIRTSPANLAQLKTVLASLDRRLRQLRITVTQDINAHNQYREDALSARINSGNVRGRLGGASRGPGASVQLGNDEAAIAYRNYSNRSEDNVANTHFVSTLEGQPAFINAGQSVPLAERQILPGYYGAQIVDSVRYRDVGAGFYVTPRLVGGDGVNLEISPYADRMARNGGGAIEINGIDTVVNGRLGEWIALGGAGQSAQNQNGTIGYSTRDYGQSQYDVWVKVEVLP